MYSIIDLLNANWLLHIDSILTYVPSLVNYINGGSGSYSPPKKEFFCYDKSLVNRYDLKYDNDIPQDSILIMNISGTQMSSDYQEYTEALRLAAANPNIISVLLNTNTPGGMVAGLEGLVNYMKSFPKPINMHVRGMAASAGMWLASGTKHISLEGSLSQMGSIGVYVSIMNMDRMMKEKFNIDIKDIYATLSTRKNEEIRQLLDSGLENDDLIIKKLDFINSHFHNTISKNLNIPLDNEVFFGAMYFVEDAIKHGLAHSIMSFDDAVNKAYNDGIVTYARNLTPKFK